MSSSQLKQKKHPINICRTQHEQNSLGNNVDSEDFETFIPHTFIDIKSVFLYMILHFYHLLLTSIQTVSSKCMENGSFDL